MYLPGYCDPALIYLMAGIANNFERIKVRVLCGVYRSQVRDTIEFSPDEQSQFDHGGPAEGVADSLLNTLCRSPNRTKGEKFRQWAVGDSLLDGLRSNPVVSGRAARTQMLRGSPGIPLAAVRLCNRPAPSSGRCCLSSDSSRPPPPSRPASTANWPIEPRQPSPHESIRMRKAVDSVSQDLLDLSLFLKLASAQRQHLLDQSNNLQQQIKRGTANSSMKTRQHEIKSDIRTLDLKVRDARQNEIPNSSFFVHLKRLHGRLPIQNPRYRNSPAHSPKVSRQVTSALKALLALPNPLLLEELAQFLLTVPLPLSEDSFLLILRRLSSLRLASAARSVYHHFMATGFYPISASSISVLLKITTSAHLAAEFRHLESFHASLRLPSDKYVHTGLVIGNLKLNRKAMALSQFSKMIFSGHEPNLQVLTALLYYSADIRDWKLGYQFWRAILDGKKNGRFEIDAWAYHAMWRLCMRCHQRQVASQILSEAVHGGYEVDKVMDHRRLKYKSLPIRSSNKSPAVQDILHAFKSYSARKAPAVSSSPPLPLSRVVDRLKDHPRTSSELPGPINAQPAALSSLSPFLQARRKIDAIYLNKIRKLGNLLSNSISLDEPEVPIPAEQSVCSPYKSLDLINMDQQMLLDAIQEKTAEEFSDWFVLTDEMAPIKSKIPMKLFTDPIPTIWENYVGIRICKHPRLVFRRRKLKYGVN